MVEKKKRRTDHTRASDKCPQKQGVRLRVPTRTPKKPNSAPRKIAKVRLSNRHDIFAHIPGEGHNLQEHFMVLIRGGRVKDSSGLKSHCIRGVKDLMGIPDQRRGARSVAEKQARIASIKMYGIGPKKAIQDSEDEPADPNIIYEEPDDEASSLDKDVSDATLPGNKSEAYDDAAHFHFVEVPGRGKSCRLNWDTAWDGNGSAHMHHLMKALQPPPRSGLSTTLSLPQNNAPR
ncbi:hypothetical protein AgCh_000347 [Apium graveolens]